MNKLRLIIPSEIGNIAKVENFIETFTNEFKLPVDLYGKVGLSVIEAVNNAILSGNKQQADKLVELQAGVVDNRLFVSVQDEGKGFDYENIPDPTLPDNLEKITGRGLYLMKNLSDELLFENGGSKVTLFFNLCPQVNV